MSTYLRNPLHLLAATALGLLLLSLGGCFTLSVHPLYDRDHLVVDPGLIGVWGDPDDPDGETWEFSADGDRAMRLVIRADDAPGIRPDQDGVFAAHLVELGGRRYLDLFPEEPEGVNEVFLAHVVPAHSFWKVERDGDTLTLYILDSNELGKAAKDGRITVDLVEENDIQVLTGQVQELQDLVVKHDALLFNDGEPMRRIR